MNLFYQEEKLGAKVTSSQPKRHGKGTSCTRPNPGMITCRNFSSLPLISKHSDVLKNYIFMIIFFSSYTNKRRHYIWSYEFIMICIAQVFRTCKALSTSSPSASFLSKDDVRLCAVIFPIAWLAKDEKQRKTPVWRAQATVANTGN